MRFDRLMLGLAVERDREERRRNCRSLMRSRSFPLSRSGAWSCVPSPIGRRNVGLVAAEGVVGAQADHGGLVGNVATFQPGIPAEPWPDSFFVAATGLGELVRSKPKFEVKIEVQPGERPAHL